MPSESNHIVSAFDEDLRQMDNFIAEMGGLAEHQFADSIKALIARDSELAERVIGNDHRIDELEHVGRCAHDFHVGIAPTDG